MKNWLSFVIVILLSACNREVKNKVQDKNLPDAESIGSVWVNAKDGIVDTVLLNKTDTAFIVKPIPIADDLGD